jgi:hypothetical protein
MPSRDNGAVIIHRHAYHRRILTVGYKKIALWIVEDMSIEHAFLRLVDHYRPEDR